ncbi:hypothetical protein [Streptomyces sp. NPDC088725]|uniref:hypothetical protein n=1 Tax=Streptomyces sp. NPDC088725 TaxID=3365873 RepID=UPI0037F1D686
MAVHQLPQEKGEFAQYFRDLTLRIDPRGGWYGVFRHRDPDGMRACLDGVEIPPWDVVESLLQDLTAARGGDAGARESVRAKHLHTAAATAHDRRPGGGEALAERLRLMLREQEYAAGRADELVRLLRTVQDGSPDAGRLTRELAWVRDDYARASARCAELGARLSALPALRPVAPGGWFRAEAPPDTGRPAPYGAGPADTAHVRPVDPAGPRGQRPGADGTDGAEGASAGPGGPGGQGGDGGTGESGRGPGPTPAARTERRAPDPEPEAKPAPEPRKKTRAAARSRPRGARFAGIEIDESDEPSRAPVLPASPPAASAAPRGARFGGAPTGPVRTAEPVHSPEDRRAAAEMAASLIRLRTAGRSGEAHVVLCEAASRPPAQLPLLADELHRAGLAADWAELLWEAASLPPAQLAAAAGALAVAGRDDDCAQLLRQGASRPASEIADAVLALDEAGRTHEAQALLGAFVQCRTPEDAALIAVPDPRRLVPRLLDAARALPGARERGLVHALRVARIPGV